MSAAAVYEIDGRARTAKEWEKVSGVRASTISSRIKKGWSVQDAVWTQAAGIRQSEIDRCVNCTKAYCDGYCEHFPQATAKQKRRRRRGRAEHGV